VTVPNVVGDSRSSAIATLHGDGFKVNVNSVTQAGAAPNTVVSQSPAGLATAAKGSTVTISVTSAALTVPDVVNMSEAQAQSVLTSSPYDYSVTVQTQSVAGTVGTVYATSPASGQQLTAGSNITIYVVGAPSSSPTPTPSVSPSSPSPTVSP
jgi:beta-lactam-binding protein with PASTA domain